MSDKLTLDAIVNLTVGTLIRGRDAEREVEKLMEKAAGSGFSKGMREGLKKSSGQLEKAWAELLEAGMVSAGKDLRKSFLETQRLQKKASEEVQKLNGAIRKTNDAALKSELQDRRNALLRDIATQKKAQDRMIARYSAEAKHRMRLLEEHEEKLAKRRLESFKEGGEAFSAVLQKGLSFDNMDSSSLVESITKGLSGALQSRAGAAGAAGNAKMMASLSSSAGIIAGVAAPLAALAGFADKAVGQTREMNRSITDSIGMIDLLGDRINDRVDVLGADYSALSVELTLLRRATIDTATEFRMTKEEVLGYTTALNDAGLTTRDFKMMVGDGATEMQAYTDTTRAAIIASKSLGVSASEVSTFIRNMQKDLGEDLTGIESGFGAIYNEARNAKIGVKSFFAAINEASAGMALYNFRLGDTAGLLNDMVDILGEDLAKSKLKLEGEFRNQSLSGRLKSTMLMGTGNAQRIIRADALKQGEDYNRRFGAIGGMDFSQEGAMRQLGGMSGKQFRDLYRQAGSPEAKRQLTSMRELAKGLQGGTMGAAQGLAGLTRTGELAAQLSQGQALLGGRAISEISPMQEMMLQEGLGMSAEQLDVLKRLDVGLRSEFEQMRETAAADDPIKRMSFQEALAAGVLSQSKTLEDTAETFDLMEQNTLDQLHETRSMNQTISNKIASLLESSSVGINHLVTMFQSSSLFGGSGADVAMRKSSFEAEERSRAALEAIGEQILDKKRALSGEKDPAARRALKDELAALETDAEKHRSNVSLEQNVRRRMAMGESGATARSSAAASVFAERFGMSPQEYLQNQSLSTQSFLGFNQVEVAKNHAPIYDDAGNLLRSGDIRSQVQSGAMSVESAQAKGFDVAIKPIEDLSEQQIEVIAAEAERTRRQQEEENKETVKKQQATTDSVVALRQTIEREQLAKITGATGLTPEQLTDMLQKGAAGEANIISRVRDSVSGGNLTEAQAREYLGLLNLDYGRSLNDFIYRGNGTSGDIFPIDRADQLVGLKPGGAIDRAGQGGGGGKTVNININGGDTAAVYRVVKQVLEETGYTDLRRY